VSTSYAHPEPTRATERARIELAWLAADTPLAQVFATACELAADALGVERVGVWLFVEGRAALRCVNLFERSRREHSVGAVLRVADFPAYFAALSIRKSVPAELATTDPRTAELAPAYLIPLGITSTLDAGIFVAGELVGVVCHEHVGPPTEWTTEARDFAGSVADQLALRVKSAEVSELRAAFRTQEDRLADLDKAESLALLAGGVAHDFRNLLTVIAGYGDLLAGREDLPADARDQARSILDAADRGGAVVRELLDFARPSPAAPTVSDLAAATAEVLPVVQAALGPRHRVKYARPAAPGLVLVEKSQYARVLLNLALNARDAMPDGGRVEVRIAPVRLPDGQEFTGTHVMLEVIDRGAGMDEATRRRAGQAYFTTKATGTGLGLAIVHRLADRAGGFVRIESAPGRGTTVRVFLPRIGASTGGTEEFTIPPDSHPT
jgi:signal transduction histidine kinase